MNTAIIVAAGTGSRFGGEIPKQFQELNGRPVISHTLSKFEECVDIDEIILVVASDRVVECEGFCGQFTKLKKIVAGGNSRAESVLNGLDASENSGIIAVHDGARPFVTINEISWTIEAAAKHGAACLVAAVTDTIKEIKDGTISGTIDRSKLRRALTPQCFKYEVIRKAFSDAESLFEATDECSLVEAIGVPIAIVEGSPQNIKITHVEDLETARAFLADGAVQS